MAHQIPPLLLPRPCRRCRVRCQHILKGRVMARATCPSRCRWAEVREAGGWEDGGVCRRRPLFPPRGLPGGDSQPGPPRQPLPGFRICPSIYYGLQKQTRHPRRETSGTFCHVLLDSKVGLRTIFGVSPPPSLPNQLLTPSQSFHIFLPLTSETARKVPASLLGSDSRSPAGVARGMGVGCQVTSWPSRLGSSCLGGLTPTTPKCRGGRKILISRRAQ